MLRVYVACPLRRTLRARLMAARLVGAGFLVTSRWHEGNGGEAIPYTDRRFAPDRPDLVEANQINTADLLAADAVVALTSEDDDGHAEGRQTYVEIGAAIALGKPVVWSSQNGGATLAQVDPLVQVVPKDETVATALDALVRVSRRFRGNVSRAYTCT
jgi:hypothetical protein